MSIGKEERNGSLMQKGLWVLLVGVVLNSALVFVGIVGIVRECARLAVLVGLGMVFAGAVAKVTAMFKDRKPSRKTRD